MPAWLVVVDEQLYARTWYRRDTGWYAALRAHRARVRGPGREPDVTVTDVGDAGPVLREQVDAAQLRAYGSDGTGSVAAIVAEEAAVTTLRLAPVYPSTDLRTT